MVREATASDPTFVNAVSLCFIYCVFSILYENRNEGLHMHQYIFCTTFIIDSTNTRLDLLMYNVIRLYSHDY